MSTSDQTTHADRLVELLNAARSSGILLDPEGRVLAVSDAARGRVEVVPGASLPDRVAPEHRAALLDALHDAGGRSGDRPVAFRLGDARHRGALRALRGSLGIVLLRLDGASEGLGRMAGLTQRQDKLAEENRRRRIRLEASQRRFEALFRHAPSGIALLDAELRSVDANPAVCALIGAERDALIGRPFASLAAEGTTVLDPGSLLKEERVVVEQEWTAVTGRELWVHCVAATMPDALGGAPDVLVHVLDVTERQEREGKLRHEARHDALTGLPNLATFRKELVDALEHGSPGWLLGLDIHHFKAINDTRGHPAGDRVLQAGAEMLATTAPEDATVARVGGDEFAVLVRGPSTCRRSEQRCCRARARWPSGSRRTHRPR